MRTRSPLFLLRQEGRQMMKTFQMKRWLLLQVSWKGNQRSPKFYLVGTITNIPNFSTRANQIHTCKRFAISRIPSRRKEMLRKNESWWRREEKRLSLMLLASRILRYLHFFRTKMSSLLCTSSLIKSRRIIYQKSLCSLEYRKINK